MIQNGLYATAAVLIVIAVGRLAFLLLCRRPVGAVALGTDLTDIQRRHDRHAYRAAQSDGVLTADDIPVRGVLTRVAYRVDDVAYRADVCLITAKGERPGSRPIVWYDPADPTRVTGIGPAPAAIVLPIAAGLIVLGYNWPF